ncbi:hypothetical protein ACJ73_03257 [Blastomyces percursus]|uniref:Uncharacterized protein n=1 Tax=Blastomyces percursus TaxID=1658174 RepID=A0A1J9RBN7_9EURO|nr:hypothetical protein ACJ73_03257 [Blastomyces percursus]
MPIPLNTPSSGAGTGSTSSTSQEQQQMQSQSSSQPQKAQPGSTTTANPSSHRTGQSGNGQLSKEEADRLFEERMEEEYAKREGGA